ncbi:MAG: hypothetical protein GXO23_05385 [Crenarchaeota archaeon]|nr:hypothetical protein [Thermoproteota archaeon]
MTRVLSISALGAFAIYGEVFYRVYIPPYEGSSKQRRSILVITNLGPLALVVANLCDILPEKQVHEKTQFAMLFLVPFTLSTYVKTQNEGEFENLIKYHTEELLRRLIKSDNNDSLVEKVNKGYERIMEFLEEYRNSSGREERALVPRIRRLSEISGAEFNGKFIFKAWETELEVKDVKYGNGLHVTNSVVLKGILTAGLIPLTGSFRPNIANGKVSRITFRDPGEGSIEDFQEATLCIYLSHIRNFLNIVYNNMELECSNLKVIIDSTHGINNVTTTMVEVIKETIPLIAYDVKRSGVKTYDFLFYNSDPVSFRDSSLQLTLTNNVSYYYTRKRVPSIKVLVNKLVDQLLRDLPREYKENSDNKEDGIISLLYNIYLITIGLVLWGAYAINRTNIAYEKYTSVDTIIDIDTKNKGNEIEVNYKVRNIRQNLTTLMLACWFYELLRDSVREFSSRTVISGLKCWKDLDKDTECYDLGKVREVLLNTSSERSWKLKFLREIIDSTALTILDNEISEWFEDPYTRLYYQSLNIFKLKKLKKGRSCGEVLNISKSDEDYYCVTPMKEQTSLRNVIAHAGLTAVHRLVAFVFKDEVIPNKEKSSVRCRFVGMCIAAPFPRSMIKDLL